MYVEKIIPAEQILSTLTKVTIFSGMNEPDLIGIYSKCTLLEIEEGEVVLEEQTPATEIYIILKGRISVIMNLKEDPLELIELGPGHCLGEVSVIGILDHSASAVVREKALLMVFTRSLLMSIFESDKALFSMLILNIAREIARRLHHTDETLLHYAKHKQVT